MVHPRSGFADFFTGVLFGPALTTWYSFLNRVKFPSPTKALLYRVRPVQTHDEGCLRFLVSFPGLAGSSYPHTRSVISFVIYSFLSPHQSHVFTHVIILTSVAVAFFYGSMSVLEGKPEEAPSRIIAVGSAVFPFKFSSSKVSIAGIRTQLYPKLVRPHRSPMASANFSV